MYSTSPFYRDIFKELCLVERLVTFWDSILPPGREITFTGEEQSERMVLSLIPQPPHTYFYQASNK